MKTYYHYSTWQGIAVHDTEIIMPRRLYAGDLKDRALPKLVFLTEDPHWEPSLQSGISMDDYKRGPSDPDEYSEKGIPCWKFEVKLPENHSALLYPHQYFYHMLEDARKLDADLSKWTWVDRPLAWLKAYKRFEAQWAEVV